MNVGYIVADNDLGAEFKKLRSERNKVNTKHVQLLILDDTRTSRLKAAKLASYAAWAEDGSQAMQSHRLRPCRWTGSLNSDVEWLGEVGVEGSGRPAARRRERGHHHRLLDH